MVALLEIPCAPCTNTIPPLDRASWMNRTAWGIQINKSAWGTSSMSILMCMMFEVACSAGIASRHTDRMWVMRLSVNAREAVAATRLFRFTATNKGRGSLVSSYSTRTSHGSYSLSQEQSMFDNCVSVLPGRHAHRC